MIEINIPGSGVLTLDHLVLDFNGTVARDGILLPEVSERICELADLLKVHVVTSDTFGHAARQLQGLPVSLHILGPSGEAAQKLEYVERLGSGSTAVIGNGSNDAAMLDAAALGICVLGPEGCSAKALRSSDVLVSSIRAGLELLVCPKRLVATLRE